MCWLIGLVKFVLWIVVNVFVFIIFWRIGLLIIGLVISYIILIRCWMVILMCCLMFCLLWISNFGCDNYDFCVGDDVVGEFFVCGGEWYNDFVLGD